MEEWILKRTACDENGVFGELHSPNGFFCYTLEHAYLKEKEYAPKVDEGVYVCKRGLHRLKVTEPMRSMFEVTGVQGHWGILLHSGNYNDDSNGCILVGSEVVWAGGEKMVARSRITYQAFMKKLDGKSEFKLTILGIDG